MTSNNFGLSTPPSYLPPPRSFSRFKSTSRLLRLLRLCVPRRVPLLPTAAEGRDGVGEGGTGKRKPAPLGALSAQRRTSRAPTQRLRKAPPRPQHLVPPAPCLRLPGPAGRPDPAAPPHR